MNNLKHKLKKLVNINSQKADEYFVGIVNDIKTKISHSGDNDEIYNNLELLEEFIYKVPEQALGIIKFILSKEPIPPKLEKTPFGEIKGKSHKDLILKCIELLSHIRYTKPDEVLTLLSELYISEDKSIKDSAGEAARKFVKYNLDILTQPKIGYGAQRKVLDFIKKWDKDEQLKWLGFVLIIAGEILDTSIEAEKWIEVDKLQMRTAQVDPTPFLKNLRREAINLLADLYAEITAPKERFAIINTLERALGTPINYSDKLLQMVLDDAEYLATAIYPKFLFNESGSLKANLAIAIEIDRKFSWFNKGERRRLKSISELREKIHSDRLYQIARVLATNDITYREDEDWATAKNKHEQELQQFLIDITLEQIDQWSDNLTRISEIQGLLDQSNFYYFKIFLTRLAQDKSDLADKILDKAFIVNSALIQFVMDFFVGFRNAKRFDLFDKYTIKIIERQDAQLVGKLCSSFYLKQEEGNLTDEIRDEDLKLLEHIVKKENVFAFLQNICDEKVKQQLNYSLIHALTRIFKHNPSLVEQLIQITMGQSQLQLSNFLHIIQLAILWKWVDPMQLSKSFKVFLLDAMVDIKNLDWDDQSLLYRLVESSNDLQSILDLFKKRIEKNTKREKSKIDEGWEYYTPISYDFNPELEKFIAEHPEYIAQMIKWLDIIDPRKDAAVLHIGHLIQRVGGIGKIAKHYINKGDDESLRRALRVINTFGDVNFDLCIEIVRQTSNPDLLSSIGGMMGNTGIVSGEYGLAEAYQGKAENLKKYLNDTSERVKEFARKMILEFEYRSRQERIRADEEKLIRKIEFEG